VGQTAIRYLAE